MIKVGLTGGIGSGKTTVVNFFKELGVPVYIADLEAKKLMNTSKSIQKNLIKVFGPQAYVNGKLNRPYLAHQVFNDEEKLKAINSIVHPKVAKHFSKWLQEQNAPYCIQENAIIFENNKAADFDFIISVTAPKDIRIERVLERDSTSKSEIMARINNQWDQAKKNELANFIIENTTLTDTKKQVKKIHEILLKAASD